MAENLNITFENNIDFKPTMSFLGAKNVTFNETVKVSVPIQFVLSTCVFKIAEQHVFFTQVSFPGNGLEAGDPSMAALSKPVPPMRTSSIGTSSTDSSNNSGSDKQQVWPLAHLLLCFLFVKYIIDLPGFWKFSFIPPSNSLSQTLEEDFELTRR